MDSCWCGRVKIANCTSCGNAACQSHFKQTPPGFRGVTVGRGPTLEAAAMNWHWQRTREKGICSSCYEQEGKTTVAEAKRRSAYWPADPFDRAVAAMAEGYICNELAEPLSLPVMTQRWLAYAQTVPVPFDAVEGWYFLLGRRGIGEELHIALAMLRVNGEWSESVPHDGALLELMEAMARKLTRARGGQWPDTSYRAQDSGF